ncbi:hypothetical protein D1007_44666 [Hordeum vulgare]|nr:hypothetical protein D1007_44666 [Hordeum vulgare]
MRDNVDQVITLSNLFNPAMCALSAFAASECPPLINMGNVARTFEFSVEFLPSKAKLVDCSVRDIERDIIVKWEVEFEEIDPQEIQRMEERAVRNVVEKIGESIFLGSRPRDDDWASERHIMPMFTGEVTVIQGDQDAKEGYDGAARVVCVDWDSIRLEDTTDLVIAPMADTEMGKNFGIRVDPLDDQDEEERGESSLPNNANIDVCQYVDGQLMKDVADDVDDAHNDELVSVHDKENHVIEVGKLFPSMKEFRMCLKTYAVKHEFGAKTMWIDRNKFYARCRGFDGSVRPCKWYISARIQPDGSNIRVNQILNPHTYITSSQRVSTMTYNFGLQKTSLEV